MFCVRSARKTTTLYITTTVDHATINEIIVRYRFDIVRLILHRKIIVRSGLRKDNKIKIHGYMGFNKPVSRKGDRKHFLSCISTSEFLRNVTNVKIVIVVQPTV